jgi:3D (Asp-Asp-Asp) domain-containing protein
LFLPAKAERVNIEKAEKIARSYARTTPRLTARRDFRHSRTVSKPLRRNSPAPQSAAPRAAQQEEPLYYVFTMNGNGGFIIVSGDDVAKPVLGYSDEGTFDENNPNLVYWMETLAQEIAGAIEKDIPQAAETKAVWDALNSDYSISPQASGDYVNPLVKTKWNQNAPYNNLCPIISGTYTVTGCVATAMAQIMKYHGRPTIRNVTIPGYKTRTKGITRPAIPGPTTYGWDNMSNTYTTSSAGVPASEVATLMYHCGVSVEMDYKVSAEGGSGAYSADVVQALKAYFDYDAGIAFHRRNYYTYAEWINLLKAEIKANRPVYYAGYGDGGHAFVCDGYDADDLFHFNWGWGGSSDGYFEISALNPGSIGIGGGSGGYNEGQEIITGVQPNRGGSGGQPAIQLGLATFSASKSSLNSLTASFNVTAGTLTNTGASTVTEAYLGVLLCNQDNSCRSYQTAKKTLELCPRYYYPSYTLWSDYSLPAGLPAGTYKLYPACSASSGTPSIIPGENGNRYITVGVGNDGKVTLTGDAEKPALSLNSLKPAGTLYRNKTGSFEAGITNSGTADYNSRLSIRLGAQTVAADPVVIPAGTTKTVGFSGAITLAAGIYSLSVWYDPNNVPESTPSTQLGDAVSPIEVKATPTEGHKLSLAATSFRNGSGAVPQNEPALTVQVKNTGGLFDNVIGVFVFPVTGGYSIGSFGQTNAWIEKNETKSLLFNNPVDFLEAGVQYMARVYYYDAEWKPLGEVFNFTVAPPTPPSSDATLKNLVVKDAQTQTPLVLTPAFLPATTSYVATATNGTTGVSIIGEANHKRAKFTNIENRPLSSGSTFNIKVTAEDEIAEKTYTVTIAQGDPPVPGNSGVINVTGVTMQGLTLDWTKATDAVTPGANLKYYVYQSASNNVNTVGDCKTNGTLLNANGTADMHACSVTGLMSNTTYYFNVVVENEMGNVAAYTAVPATTERATLTSLTANGLTPPFNPDIMEYTVTLPCGVNSFTADAAPNAGSTVSYLVDNASVTFPLSLGTPRITALVVRVTAGDGVTAQDYTVAVTRPFDVSIIRAYWNDVLAVNLNTATNGGYTFTGFQWTRNGQPVANETGPYLYFPIPPPASDRYSVLLTTTGGQTLPVCSEVQITSAEAQPAGFLAYPNPARHTVTVENLQWETAKQTDLINLRGNIVRSYPSARIQTLNVSGLPVGLYILRAGAQTVKIVIE